MPEVAHTTNPKEEEDKVNNKSINQNQCPILKKAACGFLNDGWVCVCTVTQEREKLWWWYNEICCRSWWKKNNTLLGKNHWHFRTEKSKWHWLSRKGGEMKNEKKSTGYYYAHLVKCSEPLRQWKPAVASNVRKKKTLDA
jgi:hypothetical protein